MNQILFIHIDLDIFCESIYHVGDSNLIQLGFYKKGKHSKIKNKCI